MYITEFLTESSESELPGGPAVKNPPASAGDMSWSLIWKIPHAAHVSQLPKPMPPRVHAPQEKPLQGEACA